MKPKLTKPTIERWKESEELLKQLVNHLNKKVYDINEWDFHLPGKNKTLKYKDIIPHLPVKGYPQRDYMEAVVSWFRYFPEDLERMKKSTNVILTDHTNKIEQQVNFIKQQDEYIEELETELQNLYDKVSKMEAEHKEKQLKEQEKNIEEKKQEIKSMVDNFNLAIQKLSTGQVTMPSLNPIPQADQNTMNAMDQLNNRVPKESPEKAQIQKPSPSRKKPQYKRSYA